MSKKLFSPELLDEVDETAQQSQTAVHEVKTRDRRKKPGRKPISDKEKTMRITTYVPESLFNELSQLSPIPMSILVRECIEIGAEKVLKKYSK